MNMAKAVSAGKNGPFPGAEGYIPATTSLSKLASAAQQCRGCDLYRRATQAVFGDGTKSATIMLIGEQPGDQEDVQGRAFVGPAGGILRKALNEAGIDPQAAYITNAVKHFKWTPAPRGKRRIHSRPTMAQFRACRPWLEREIALVAPKVIVLLGASAGQSLLGSKFRVGAARGKAISGAQWSEWLVPTIHPSAVLRAPDDDARHEAYAAFVQDLKIAASAAEPAAGHREDADPLNVSDSGRRARP